MHQALEANVRVRRDEVAPVSRLMESRSSHAAVLVHDAIFAVVKVVVLKQAHAAIVDQECVAMLRNGGPTMDIAMMNPRTIS